MLSALSVTFGDSSPKGGATGVPVRPHSLRGVLFYQKQKCSAVQIHDILTGIIVQKPLFLTTAHCILRHICFQQSAQSFPACQSLSPWERWHCKAMTERAGPVRQSRRTAISRPFVSAMLSPCLHIFVSILALSVTFGDSSPKGGATGVPGRPTRDKQSLLYPKTVVPCYRGQQLRNNVPCQAAVNLCSRALFFTLY